MTELSNFSSIFPFSESKISIFYYLFSCNSNLTTTGFFISTIHLECFVLPISNLIEFYGTNKNQFGKTLKITSTWHSEDANKKWNSTKAHREKHIVLQSSKFEAPMNLKNCHFTLISIIFRCVKHLYNWVCPRVTVICQFKVY